MNRSFQRVLLSSFLLLIGSAVAVSAQTVTGSIGNGTVTKGRVAKGTVVLSIPGHLHVNSNRPNSEFAIPTTVRLIAEGATVGRVTYPPGKNKRFQFSNTPINVYDGKVTFPFTVTVPRNFRGTTLRVRAVVRYQACTDEVCYPPRNQEVTITAKVR